MVLPVFVVAFFLFLFYFF